MHSNTYRAKTFIDAAMPIMKQLQAKQKRPINALKASWYEVAPEWATVADPYTIKEGVLLLKANPNQALILQYREQELLKIAQIIIGDVVKKIKVLSY